MKYSFLSIALLACLFMACNNSSKEDHGHDHGTHVHEDGSVHQNHDTTQNKQEEFVPDKDSTMDKVDTTVHTHKGGHHHTH